MSVNGHQNPAISFRDVVKSYRLHSQKGRTLKEAFLRQKIYEERIMALDGVSFEIQPGTTVGIIGPNGAGKSTSLKLIAGTSMPTSGSISVSGKVSALLELGAGFHPEFTGKENIFLNGAIMGLPKRTIEELYDQIVDFAELGDFIDVPVKTYSSGMYLRLAFSVAINVDPDILLIDEVFAVGDESFQHKCLERINDFRVRGKTILFVSHSLGAVRGLCEEAIWLEKGKVMAKGTTNMVVDRYLSSVIETEDQIASMAAFTERDRWGTGRARITGVAVTRIDGSEAEGFRTGDDIRITLGYQVSERIEAPVFGCAIHRDDDLCCYATNTSELEQTPEFLEAGEGEVCLDLRGVELLPGNYRLTTAILNLEKPETYDYHDRMYALTVSGGPHGEGVFNLPHGFRFSRA